MVGVRAVVAACVAILVLSLAVHLEVRALSTQEDEFDYDATVRDRALRISFFCQRSATIFVAPVVRFTDSLTELLFCEGLFDWNY
jgi:hypothetical protein